MASTDIGAIRLKVANALRPPPKLTVSEWADTRRWLSPEASSEAGRWHTERAPYTKGMMDAVNEVGVRRIVYMMASQVGKTESVNNILGYLIDRDPAGILYVWPTLDAARKWSQQRLAPMLRDTPCLRGKVKDARSRDAENATLLKKFPGGMIVIAGSNSPTSLAAIPVRIVLASEIDRFEASAGTEGDPLELAGKRTSNFWNAIEIWESSPTLDQLSRVQSAYESSDQRIYKVPCPYCGFMQALWWRNIKFVNRDPATTHLECEACHQPIQHGEKYAMLAKGKWDPQRPFIGIAGFHLNALYSPWIAWETLVREHLDALGDYQKRKVFINTRLAEVWREQAWTVSDNELMRRREEYPPDCDCPEGVLVLTAGVDVQDDRLEYEVVGWGQNGESWSVARGELLGNPALGNVWEELDAKVLLRTYLHQSGLSLRVICGMVDSGGHHTKRVYDFCQVRLERHIYACKGESGGGKPLVLRPTQRREAGRFLFRVGTDAAKELIYSRLKLNEFGAGYCHFPLRSEYDEEFFKQLCAERLVIKFKAGYRHAVWEPTRPRNEALDCRVYALAALDARRVDFDAVSRSMAQSRAEQEKAAAPPPPEQAIEAVPDPPKSYPGSAPPLRSLRPRRPGLPKNWINNWR